MLNWYSSVFILFSKASNSRNIQLTNFDTFWQKSSLKYKSLWLKYTLIKPPNLQILMLKGFTKCFVQLLLPILPIAICCRHDLILQMKLTFCECLQNRTFLLILLLAMIRAKLPKVSFQNWIELSCSLHSSSYVYQSQCFSFAFLFYFLQQEINGKFEVF